MAILRHWAGLYRSITTLCLTFIILLGAISFAAAMPFGYRGGYEIYPGIHKDDPAFERWATGWQDYHAGSHVDEGFKTPEKALGKATGNAYDIVSLGRGGSITMTFEPPIQNGKGWDFAVFENSFSDRFLELAYVEVSTNGVDFVRFPNCSLTPSPVSAFGTIDPASIIGLAGKYRQGYGTPFDLEDLARTQKVDTGIVDLDQIIYVRIIDIVGDGTCYDNRIGDLIAYFGKNGVIYDPYPTFGSAGFDLEAIGVKFTPKGSAPYPPILLMPFDAQGDVSLTPGFRTEDFSDPDPNDTHIRTQWQISTQPEFSYLIFDISGSLSLTSLRLIGPILHYGNTYYWRVRFFDEAKTESEWSVPFSFSTTDITGDSNENGIPDIQELADESLIDLNMDSIPDTEQMNSQFKCLNTHTGKQQMGISTLSESVSIEFMESVDPNTIPANQSPGPDHLPLGLLGFRLKCPSSDTVMVTIYISEPASENVRWYICNQTGWLDYLFISEKSQMVSDRRSITLELQDGGPGDMDGVKNSVIVSLGGLGCFISGEAGLGGLSGCFISTI